MASLGSLELRPKLFFVEAFRGRLWFFSMFFSMFSIDFPCLFFRTFLVVFDCVASVWKALERKRAKDWTAVALGEKTIDLEVSVLLKSLGV